MKTLRPHGILDASEHASLHGGPSFTLRHRLFRAAWMVCWTMLARWTPPPFHPWRRLLLRLFGAHMGHGARVYGSAQIWYPPHLSLGRHAVLGPGVICYAMAPIHIGDEAIVSQRSHLCAGSHDVDDPNFQLIAKAITIDAKAWIAAEAFVGPGVTVGRGAVLGARGVTMRDLDPWTIYVGNPARPLRPRTTTPAPGETRRAPL